jgi:hypothetical protein
MIDFSTTTSHLAVVLGVTALVCWIAAGFAAVLGTKEEIRHADTGRLSEYVMSGLAALGLSAVLAMGAVLVFAA